MKLNNKGWGLGTFIAFAGVFVIAIIIISVNAYRLGLNTTDLNSTFSDQSEYREYETRILNAAKKYISRNDDEVKEGSIEYITVHHLIDKGLIKKITDGSKNVCSGYVKVINDGTYEYTSYIKCGSKYQTNGYLSEYDK